MIEHPNREDCYIARLLVRKVSPEDSKKYFLAVENIHGEDRYAVALNVKGMYKIILFQQQTLIIQFHLIHEEVYNNYYIMQFQIQFQWLL